MAVTNSWVTKSFGTVEPWGTTQVWTALKNLHGKLISIKEGHRTSLKYHNVKNEVFFVLTGKVKVHFANSDFVEKHNENSRLVEAELSPGDVFVVQPGSVYRFTAVENCALIEVGNRLHDESIRLADDYGRDIIELETKTVETQQKNAESIIGSK